MRIAINVKTNKKAIKPAPDNIIIYDGKDWYVTTKEELFKEYDQKFEKKVKECETMLKEMEEFQVNISKQMLEYGSLVKEFIKQGE